MQIMVISSEELAVATKYIISSNKITPISTVILLAKNQARGVSES